MRVPPANDPKAHPAGRVLGEGVYVARTDNMPKGGLLAFIMTNVREARPLTVLEVALATERANWRF